MDPTFSELYDDRESAMLRDAYNTLNLLDMLDWLREFETHPNEGFMFSTDMNLVFLSKELGYGGSSFVWTMQTLQHVLKYGWDEHKKFRRANITFTNLSIH